MEPTFTTIQQQFGVQLHNIICSKVEHQAHCHDIMQEVYLKILLHLPKIEKANNMAAYLVQLTNNTVMDHYRKFKPAIQVALANEISAENEHQTIQSLRLADCCLRPMIESLPAIYREALIMTELEGMKQKEYAEKVGITISNAKMRVQRAKEKLKEIILECCSYDFDKYGNIIDCRENGPSACCKK